jgi:hypothetical protein
LSERHAPGPAALRALSQLSVRRNAITIARGTRLQDRDAYVDPSSTSRHPERDLNQILDILSTALALRSLGCTSAEIEDRAEQIAESARICQILEAKPARLPCTAWGTGSAETETAETAEAAHLIVLLALLLVRQNTIRFRYVLELLGRLGVVRICVRMIPLGKLAVGLFKLILADFLVHAEDVVVVLGAGSHQISSGSRA